MKLWLLRPERIYGDTPDAWEPWYDKAWGFVVRAESEEEARLLAADEHGDEGLKAWLDPEQSTCEELTADGDAEVIIQEFRNA